MSFEIRHQLLTMLSNNATAYDIANKFVADDKDKLTVFTGALNESRGVGGIDAQAAAATKIAEERWNTINPPA